MGKHKRLLRARLLSDRMIHRMTANQPIDYARAESADVVRKKFRRRVVMFVIATVVVMAIAGAWSTLGNQSWRLFPGQMLFPPNSIKSSDGYIYLHGPTRTVPLALNDEPERLFMWHGNDVFGIRF